MKLTDQELAKHLLQRKHLGGKRPPFSTRQKVGYLIWAGIAITAMLLLIRYPDQPVGWFLLGAISAAAIRDFKWYRAIRLCWPFTEKVTDWDKVDELSKGKYSRQG